MSSSTALLEQDFGSESEDDNFNPAPADESDNDAAGESDADSNAKKSTHTTEQKRRTVGEERTTEGADTEVNGSALVSRKVEQPEDEDEDGENGINASGLLKHVGS